MAEAKVQAEPENINNERGAVILGAALIKLLLPSLLSTRYKEIKNPWSSKVVGLATAVEAGGMATAVVNPVAGAVLYGCGRLMSLIAERVALQKK